MQNETKFVSPGLKSYIHTYIHACVHKYIKEKQHDVKKASSTENQQGLN